MTTDQPTLLPCPFCGDTPKGVDFQRKYDFDFAVECNCGACMSQCQYAGGPGQESRDKTIEQWNTRAPSSELTALRAEVERVRGELDKAVMNWESVCTEINKIDALLDNYGHTPTSLIVSGIVSQRDVALARVRELEGVSDEMVERALSATVPLYYEDDKHEARTIDFLVPGIHKSNNAQAIMRAALVAAMKGKG
jgi:Lar family restriction alleviation protein